MNILPKTLTLATATLIFLGSLFIAFTYTHKNTLDHALQEMIELCTAEIITNLHLKKYELPSQIKVILREHKMWVTKITLPTLNIRYSNDYCLLTTTIALNHYAVNWGQVEFCHSLPHLFQASASSPFFLIAVLSCIIILIFSVVFSMRIYRHALLTSRAAKQVAHDIKSPLSVLQIIAKTNNDLSEKKRSLLNQALERINNMLDTLKKPEHQAKNTAQLKTPLIPAINEIIHEQKISSKNTINFLFTHTASQSECYGAIETSTFKRIIANLLTNAIESISHNSGLIKIELTSIDHCWHLTIADNGCGIDCQILPSLMHEGITFNKPSGNGFGLYYARTELLKIRGNLTISSIPNHGTTLLVTIPKKNIA